MRRKDTKTRCERRMIAKCKEVCKTYDAIQSASADYLSSLPEIVDIRCNVHLEGLGLDAEYMTDFVCIKNDNSIMVRECVLRRFLTKPMTVRLLEYSRVYWEEKGCTDWGLIIDEEI